MIRVYLIMKIRQKKKKKTILFKAMSNNRYIGINHLVPTHYGSKRFNSTIHHS